MMRPSVSDNRVAGVPTILTSRRSARGAVQSTPVRISGDHA